MTPHASPDRGRPFIFFDLGNVLLFFDHRRAARQMAAVAGADPERVWNLVFAGDLNLRCDSGELDEAGFHELFCRETQTRPDRAQLVRAAAEIFTVNASLLAVVAQLKAAGYRLGILSNTCDMHWNYFGSGRYALIPEAFDTVVLSFELKMMKPGREIYLKAAELAGVPPEEVFYADDLAVNVAGARAAGFDAVQYTSTPAIVADLRRRGLRFNY